MPALEVRNILFISVYYRVLRTNDRVTRAFMVEKGHLWLFKSGHLWFSYRTSVVEEGHLWFSYRTFVVVVRSTKNTTLESPTKQYVTLFPPALGFRKKDFYSWNQDKYGCLILDSMCIVDTYGSVRYE
jgi:hypothetical protein